MRGRRRESKLTVVQAKDVEVGERYWFETNELKGGFVVEDVRETHGLVWFQINGEWINYGLIKNIFSLETLPDHIVREMPYPTCPWCGARNEHDMRCERKHTIDETDCAMKKLQCETCFKHYECTSYCESTYSSERIEQ